MWPRCDAETSPERGFYYHPSRHSAGQPIVAGWAYQWIAQLSFDRESWVAPMDVMRVRPSQNANACAVEQVEALARRLPPGGAVPLFVFDAGYDAARLQRGLAGCRAQILVRLRAGRCFYADPPEAPPGRNGRPRRHGRKMECGDPSAWPEPATEHSREDGRYGQVRARAWPGLHAKTQNHPGHGSRGPRPIERGTLILVEVDRLLPQRTREPRVLWLWWSGPEGIAPDLDLLWRAYVRRFDVEHTFRFLKQALGWTTPRFRHPEQADRWT